MYVGRTDANEASPPQDVTAPEKLQGGSKPPKRSNMLETDIDRPQKTFVCTPYSLPRAAGIATG